MKEYKYKINGNEYKVSVEEMEGNLANVVVNGTSYKVEMDKPAKAEVKPVVRPVAAPAPAPAAAAAPAAKPAAGGQGKAMQSPLPGVIIDIKVNVGDTVTKGQTVAILEAMKMENNINAEFDGKVTAIAVNKGDSVQEGADLIFIA